MIGTNLFCDEITCLGHYRLTIEGFCEHQMPYGVESKLGVGTAFWFELDKDMLHLSTSEAEPLSLSYIYASVHKALKDRA